MPRRAREKSKSGIYHVIIRGANRQEIFHDDRDRMRFLETLERYKKQCKFKLYGWCLMNNHLHMLIQEGDEELAVTMKRIGVSYVWYYNWKYGTMGHLFQDRYKSEKVEDEKYLLTVIRYIHQNPVKAGIVDEPSTWKWSSCAEYYGKRSYPIGLLDSELILGLFSEKQDSAIQKFKGFSKVDNDDKCLEDNVRIRLKDEEVKAEIKRMIPKANIGQIKSLPKEERSEIIRKIKCIEGASQRQLSRILGISQTLISMS